MRFKKVLNEERSLIDKLREINSNVDWEKYIIFLYNQGNSQIEIVHILENQYGVKTTQEPIRTILTKYDIGNKYISKKEYTTAFTKLLEDNFFTNTSITIDHVKTSDVSLSEKIVMACFIKMKENPKLGARSLAKYIKSEFNELNGLSEETVGHIQKLFINNSLISNNLKDSTRVPRLILLPMIDLLKLNNNSSNSYIAGKLSETFSDLLNLPKDTIRKNLGTYDRNIPKEQSIDYQLKQGKSPEQIFNFLIEKNQDARTQCRTWLYNNLDLIKEKYSQLYDLLMNTPSYYNGILSGIIQQKFDVKTGEEISIRIYVNTIIKARYWDINTTNNNIVLSGDAEIAPFFVKEFNNVREGYLFIKAVENYFNNVSQLWEIQLTQNDKLRDLKNIFNKELTDFTNIEEKGLQKFQDKIENLFMDGEEEGKEDDYLRKGKLFTIELSNKPKKKLIQYSRGLSYKKLLYAFAEWYASQSIDKVIENRYTNIIKQCEQIYHGKLIKETFDIKTIAKTHYDAYGKQINEGEYIDKIAVDSKIYSFTNPDEFKTFVEKTKESYNNKQLVYGFTDEQNKLIYVGVTLNWGGRVDVYKNSIMTSDGSNTYGREQKITKYIKNRINSNQRVGWVIIKQFYPAALNIYRSIILPLEKYLIATLRLRKNGYNVDAGGKNASSITQNFNTIRFTNILNSKKNILTEAEFKQTWAELSMQNYGTCPYKYIRYYIIKYWEKHKVFPTSVNYKNTEISNEYLPLFTNGTTVTEKSEELTTLNNIIKTHNKKQNNEEYKVNTNMNIFEQLNRINDSAPLSEDSKLKQFNNRSDKVLYILLNTLRAKGYITLWRVIKEFDHDLAVSDKTKAYFDTTESVMVDSHSTFHQIADELQKQFIAYVSKEGDNNKKSIYDNATPSEMFNLDPIEQDTSVSDKLIQWLDDKSVKESVDKNIIEKNGVQIKKNILDVYKDGRDSIEHCVIIDLDNEEIIGFVGTYKEAQQAVKGTNWVWAFAAHDGDDGSVDGPNLPDWVDNKYYAMVDEVVDEIEDLMCQWLEDEDDLD